MLKFKNANLMGIQVNGAPLSPRTERFFKAKGVEVTYTPDGYVALSNLNITKTDVDEFLQSRDKEAVVHATASLNKWQKSTARSTGTLTVTEDDHVYPIKQVSIILEGDLAENKLAIYAQKIGSDAPGILKVGIKNITTGTVELIELEEKLQGEDFVVLTLKHEPHKIQIVYGIIQTPPEHNNRIIPLQDFNGHPVHQLNNFWLNCNENTAWIDPNNIASRNLTIATTVSETESKQYLSSSSASISK